VWMVSLMGLVRLRAASVLGFLLLVNLSLRSTNAAPSHAYCSSSKTEKGQKARVL